MMQYHLEQTEKRTREAAAVPNCLESDLRVKISRNVVFHTLLTVNIWLKSTNVFSMCSENHKKLLGDNQNDHVANLS